MDIDIVTISTKFGSIIPYFIVKKIFGSVNSRRALSERTERASIIICTNLEFSRWTKLFDEHLTPLSCTEQQL